MPTAMVTTDDLDDFLAGDPQNAIEAATAIVRSYCGWHVSPSVTEDITIQRQAPLAPTFLAAFLPTLYVTDVSAVTVDGTELDALDWEWTENGLLLKSLSSGWPYTYTTSRLTTITVTLTHGYPAADVADLTNVVLRLASQLKSTPGGGFVRQVGQVVYATPTGDGASQLFDSEKAVLDKYRIVPVS